MTMVGFIGLGRMGKPMALNLLRAGFGVVALSRSRGPVEELVAAGAEEGASLADAASRAEIVCSCLPDVAASRSAYLGEGGLAANARPGQTFVEHGTIAPSLAVEVGAALAARGAGYVDAPVSGGVERAESGTLTIMAGGSERDVEAARPALEAVGSVVHRVGPVGRGSLMKLTNQLLVGVHTLAACEGFAFGEAAGADGAQLGEALRSSWGASAMLARNWPLMLSGDYGSLAPIRLLAKDLGLVADAAREMGLPLPVAERARALFDEAMAQGLGEEDVAAMIRLAHGRAPLGDFA